jgi:hypothetical protein
MYINRKTGERVEVKRVDEHIMAVNDGNDGWLSITMANFNEQYGEAMICQHKCPDLSDCGGNHNIPHIKNRWCAEGCFGYPCIPYIPKQKADNEPVFPVCGTCNAQKDANACDTQGNLGGTKEPKPNLMLSDEEIRELIRVGLSKDWVVMEYSKLLLQNELDHLAKPEFNIYVKVKTACEMMEELTGDCGECVLPCKNGYIPLADYMKGEGK